MEDETTGAFSSAFPSSRERESVRRRKIFQGFGLQKSAKVSRKEDPPPVPAFTSKLSINIYKQAHSFCSLSLYLYVNSSSDLYIFATHSYFVTSSLSISLFHFLHCSFFRLKIFPSFSIMCTHSYSSVLCSTPRSSKQKCVCMCVRISIILHRSETERITIMRWLVFAQESRIWSSFGALHLQKPQPFSSFSYLFGDLFHYLRQPPARQAVAFQTVLCLHFEAINRNAFTRSAAYPIGALLERSNC